MTVSELLAKLHGLPEDMLVVVRGYEGGYDDVRDVRMLKLELNPNAWEPRYKEYYWYYGVYEQVYKDSGSSSFDAAFIEQFDEGHKHKTKRELLGCEEK